MARAIDGTMGSLKLHDSLTIVGRLLKVEGITAWVQITRGEIKHTFEVNCTEMETVEIGALVGCCFSVMTTSLGGPFRKVGSASTLHALGA
jgi:hypothetical protein